MAALSRRSKPTGVAAALASIESHYGQQLAAPGGPAAGQAAALPGWAKQLAIRLSPSGVAGSLPRPVDLPGHPPGGTPKRILALHGTPLFLGAPAVVLFNLRPPA